MIRIMLVLHVLLYKYVNTFISRSSDAYSMQFVLDYTNSYKY